MKVEAMMDPEDLPKVRSTRDQVEIALTRLLVQHQPGDQLPPEPDLARQLGVSRPTLRDVLRSFAERGLLVRRQGVGTFVATRLPVVGAGLEVLESLDRMTDRLGLTTLMAHLTVSERQATDQELRGLGRHEPMMVLVVDRVIGIEDLARADSGAHAEAGADGQAPVRFRPIADLRDVVPVEYLSASDLDDGFRGSVLDLLLARDAAVLRVSRTQILTEVAGPERAARLRVGAADPLLVLVAQLFSYDERVVDYSVSVFVPGYVEFHVMRQVRA
jgi:DNA-binding GntR family transcriptional regulator